MKNFWKNICIGAMAVTSVVGFSGCKKNNTAVSVDLDGDGVVAEWETLFGSAPSSNRVTIANVVEINNFNELKAINDSTETKVYKLNANIDCGGQELSINLGQSSLYGNNKVIKNFKLGDCAILGDNENSGIKAKGLFYNGVAVYDLRLFMGNQQFSFKEASTSQTISPFVNVPILDSVVVKGRIVVDRQYTDKAIQMSLLASSVEGKRSDLSITNCAVIGDMEYTENNSYSQVYVGGIAPKLWSSDFVYNCTSSVDMDIEGTQLMVGGIAGVNEGFVTTVHSKGNINTGYEAMGNSYIGGIVGSNGKIAEIKNASTNAVIGFNQPITLSGEDELAIGGIAGLNNGVINYTTSDATINITKSDAIAYVGSIAGKGEFPVYYNVIGRGFVNATNCAKLYVADISGYSKYGYFDKVIAATNINVDNSAIPSNMSSYVNLGLVTIFEDFSKGDLYYNALYSPNFKNILISGTTNIYTNSSLSSSGFRYNLGLRNKYEQIVNDETDGGIEVTPDPELGDDELEGEEGVEEIKTTTILPKVYNNLYLLSDRYTLNKYKMVEGVQTLEAGLNLTYADKGSGSAISHKESTGGLQESFFIQKLGFNYIVGDNDIDLAKCDISKMQFTLKKDACLERYFSYNKKEYNGNLTAFDKEFENVCTYDISDEMFSYLNKLITVKLDAGAVYREYSPLIISNEFATSVKKSTEVKDVLTEDYPVPETPDDMFDEDGGNGESGEETIPPIEDEGSTGENPEGEDKDYMSVAERFAENIVELLKLMNLSATKTFKGSDGTTVIDLNVDDISQVKYVEIQFFDAKYIYTIEFDVTNMVNDVENVNSNYIVFIDFHKDIK